MKIFNSASEKIGTKMVEIRSPDKCQSLRNDFSEFENEKELENFRLMGKSDGVQYTIVSNCYFENCVLDFHSRETAFQICYPG